MIFTIYSNFFNHHQKPVCDVLFNELKNNFTFVSTMAMPNSFVDAGYPDYSGVSYNLLSFENNKNLEKAMDLMLTSDVVLFGDAPFELVEPRLKMNKLILFSTERKFKKGNYQRFDYRILWELYNRHTKHRNKNSYMLCAGAFTANDYTWVKAYPEKMFKWGYFPIVKPLDINKVLKSKQETTFRILMVCRLIPWKQPQLALEMARKLNQSHLDFELQIIGTGELSEKLKFNTKKYGLENNVVFLGNMPNEQVSQKMQNAHALIFTSDRNEGWGAVTNEAMANGCTVVGSNEIGSMPYLINPGKNGLIFKSNNANDLTKKILSLYYDREYCERLAIKAYADISKVWSPENAGGQLLKKAKELLKDEKQTTIIQGPCSTAHQTNFDWFKIKS